jgi:glycosyltransferase involved in cell wall biosynthesis
MAGRPTTFMFEEIVKLLEPHKRRIAERDRAWVNDFIEKLYQKADVVLVNSKFIQSQLKKYYNIDSFVVYPPVDLDVFKPSTRTPTRDYFLSVQRVHWQKRILLQIDAFSKLPNEKLLIVGDLNREKRDETLLEIVKPYRNIKFLGKVSQRKLVDLYSNAKATIQTGYYEDFGIVPVESMACGTPVICVDEGGFIETVHSPELGIRIKPPYLENLRKAVQNFDISNYNPEILRREAEKYGLHRFKREMEKYVRLAVERHKARCN